MPCPPFQDLEDYVSARSDEARTAIADHLSGCSACRDRLADVEANLGLTDALRAAGRNGVAAAAPLPETVGAYRIVRELGRGGMGVVYLAEQTHPRRRVALKLVRPDLATTETLRRLEQEANTLAQLQHAGIAAIFEAGVAPVFAPTGACGEQPFFAMELVEGARLDQYASEHALDRRARLELFARVADAVHHAHVKGVIHRDLKPGNIVVEVAPEPQAARAGRPAAPRAGSDEATKGGRPGQPKVLDFGVARVVRPELGAGSTRTDAGKLLGTIPYMSPEQVAGDSAQVDARSDVYALGVIGYQLLSGALPYDLEGRSLLDAARVIGETEPRRLGSVDPRLRGDVETIFATALAKDPDRRYQSAAELAADVRRCVAHEPIAARPATALYHLGRFARRNRAVVATSLVALAALVVGFVLALWQAHVATRAKDDARQQLAEAVRQGDYLMNGVVANLGTVLGAENVRESIADEVHAFFAELAPKHPDNLDVQQGLWESLRLRAAFARQRGESDRALELMRVSHELVRRAHAAHPDDPEVRFQLGYSLRHLADALAPVDPDAAEAAVRESVDALARLVEDEPRVALYRRTLGVGFTRLAGHDAHRDPQQAERRLHEAIRQYERARDLDGDTLRAGLSIAGARSQLGGLAEAGGRPAEAEVELEAALDLMTTLAATTPDDVRVVSGLGASALTLARLRLARGDPRARPDALRAVAQYERMASAEPGRPGSWRQVAAAYDVLSAAARADGLVAEAERCAQQAADARDRARMSALDGE